MTTETDDERLRLAHLEIFAFNARATRNSLIAGTDWRFTSDRPFDAAWAAYRQALRDITTQPGFPENIEWPHEPE
jgi:hypothetical protein